MVNLELTQSEFEALMAGMGTMLLLKKGQNQLLGNGLYLVFEDDREAAIGLYSKISKITNSQHPDSEQAPETFKDVREHLYDR